MKLSIEELKAIKLDKLDFVDADDVEIFTHEPDRPSNQFVYRSNPKITLKHKPTGVTVVSEEHQSQHLNKNQALHDLNQILSEYVNV